MEYTNDQKNVLNIILDWWNSYQRSPYLAVAGYAGTGKTTLIADLPKYIKKINRDFIRISYATLTAKAALVLKNKGIPASTIHSLIYDTQVIKDPITGKVKYIFRKKEFLNSDLIVIDESSMVSEELYNDLKSFGIPILFIGDSFQLPPVTGDFNLMTNKFLSYTMSEIMRQEAENDIITMSMKLRKGMNIPYGSGKNFHKIHRSRFNDNYFLNCDQVITGKNITKVNLNIKIRELYNRFSELPVIGDKMIFLRNNYEDNVFNGQQVVVTKEITPTGKNKFELTFQDLVDEHYVDKVIITSSGINNPYTPNDVSKGINIVDFGYAISCHKAQGSQWNKVLLYDDFFALKNEETRFRWLYTAVTRAIDEVMWIC